MTRAMNTPIMARSSQTLFAGSVDVEDADADVVVGVVVDVDVAAGTERGTGRKSSAGSEGGAT